MFVNEFMKIGKKPTLTTLSLSFKIVFTLANHPQNALYSELKFLKKILKVHNAIDIYILFSDHFAFMYFFFKLSASSFIFSFPWEVSCHQSLKSFNGVSHWQTRTCSSFLISSFLIVLLSNYEHVWYNWRWLTSAGTSGYIKKNWNLRRHKSSSPEFSFFQSRQRALFVFFDFFILDLSLSKKKK